MPGGPPLSDCEQVQPYIQNAERVLDPRQARNYNPTVLKEVMNLAGACVAQTVAGRPDMDEVARRLAALKAVLLGKDDAVSSIQDDRDSVSSTRWGHFAPTMDDSGSVVQPALSVAYSGR